MSKTPENDSAPKEPSIEQEVEQGAQSSEVTATEIVKAPPSALRKLLTAVIAWLIIRLTPVWNEVKRLSLPVLMRFWELLKKLAASRLGRFVTMQAQKYWQKFTATQAGKWAVAYYIERDAKIRERVAEWKEIYRKLTSPPPDPLMAAMMMTDEPIDMVDDVTESRSRVFNFIVTFVGIFVLWASFAELDESVRAEGSIVPPSSVQLVQNRLPGSVVSIETKLGQHVEKGQVLFKLEDEDVTANFDENEITRIASLAMKARLTAEVEGAEEVNFPRWIETAAPQVASAERDVFKRRLKALGARLTSIERRIENHEERIGILKPLVEAGHEARLTLVDAQGQLNYAVDEREALLAEFRADAAGRLAEVNLESEHAGAREDALIAKVANAEVRAPTSGTVSAVHIKTVGAVVQGGTVMAEIVPDEKNVLVRARLLAEDITDVDIGQIAQVSLAAYDVSRYGTLEGRIQRVAQNTTQEEGMPPYYETIIEVPEPRFSKSEVDLIIIPGSPVVVDIIGNKRTVMSYILTPLNKAAGRAFREK